MDSCWISCSLLWICIITGCWQDASCAPPHPPGPDCEAMGGVCIEASICHQAPVHRHKCEDRGDVCCIQHEILETAQWYSECGESNYDDACENFNATSMTGSNQIVGGVKARKGELPWQVLITLNRVPKCGAVLIDDTWILTAAHCVRDAAMNQYMAVLGEHDRFETNPDRVSVTFQSITIHPAYNEASKEHDVALVKLNTHLQLSNYVHPACSPGPVNTYLGADCAVSGWGLTSPVDGNAEVLHYAKVSVMGPNKCRTMMQGAGTIHDTNLCAGGDGKDACAGDSGGPLVCNMNGLFQLVGLVSWGIGCGEMGSPGVYTSVPHYMDWIEQVRNP